jgi:hypothetical protein
MPIQINPMKRVGDDLSRGGDKRSVILDVPDGINPQVYAEGTAGEVNMALGPYLGERDEVVYRPSRGDQEYVIPPSRLRALAEGPAREEIIEGVYSVVEPANLSPVLSDPSREPVDVALPYTEDEEGPTRLGQLIRELINMGFRNDDRLTTYDPRTDEVISTTEGARLIDYVRELDAHRESNPRSVTSYRRSDGRQLSVRDNLEATEGAVALRRNSRTGPIATQGSTAIQQGPNSLCAQRGVNTRENNAPIALGDNSVAVQQGPGSAIGQGSTVFNNPRGPIAPNGVAIGRINNLLSGQSVLVRSSRADAIAPYGTAISFRGNQALAPYSVASGEIRTLVQSGGIGIENIRARVVALPHSQVFAPEIGGDAQIGGQGNIQIRGNLRGNVYSGCTFNDNSVNTPSELGYWRPRTETITPGILPYPLLCKIASVATFGAIALAIFNRCNG